MNVSFEFRALAWAVITSLLALVGAGLVAVSIEKMQGPATASADAFTEIVASPELVTQGHQFYDMSCSHCHGDDATGDEGPDLHNLTISNARIAKTIKNGVKGEMPTFAKKYDDKQIAALVSFLRTLK